MYRKRTISACRQYILNTAIRDLRLDEATEKTWQKLKRIAQKYSIENSKPDDILAFYSTLVHESDSRRTRRIEIPGYATL